VVAVAAVICSAGQRRPCHAAEPRSGIHEALGIEGLFDAAHQGHALRVLDQPLVLSMQADAVFAGAGAAQAHRAQRNPSCQVFGSGGPGKAAAAPTGAAAVR
jgi:hypothetical protein